MENTNWQRFRKYHFYNQQLGLQVDISKIKFDDEYLAEMESQMLRVNAAIKDMESGAIANPDENRMVGHYWLRRPELAPSLQISEEILNTQKRIKEFISQIHNGYLKGETGNPFKNVLLIGIGGSSLGPRFISDALEKPSDKMKLFFLDNTDPDGIDRVLSRLKQQLDVTLAVVISKSGGTVETRNGMEEVRQYYKEQGLDFAKHAVSITQKGSLLEQTSASEGWLRGFPMWDWVGGRTSVLSAVGLLPLALQGVDIDLLLEGARRCDELTGREEIRQNPAALLALMWYKLTGGQGGKQMIVLPYKDRLELFTKYLQQLIMESLGKETDLDGKPVHQGITVLGNKGSTDQHSYLQQLFDGPDNFFVTFIEVLKDREGKSKKIAGNSTSGDYLQAFLLGTRKALDLKGRESITITIDEVNELTLGVLIALYERAVSIYALLVNINAYHQPAVELGKKSASEVIALKNEAVGFLHVHKGSSYTVQELGEELAGSELNIDLELLFKVLQHAASNSDHGIRVNRGKELNYGFFDIKYFAEDSFSED